MAVVILLWENVDNKNLPFCAHSSIYSCIFWCAPRRTFVTTLFLMFINYILKYIVFRQCKYLLYYADDLKIFFRVNEISDFSKIKNDKYLK